MLYSKEIKQFKQKAMLFVGIALVCIASAFIAPKTVFAQAEKQKVEDVKPAEKEVVEASLFDVMEVILNPTTLPATTISYEISKTNTISNFIDTSYAIDNVLTIIPLQDENKVVLPSLVVNDRLTGNTHHISFSLGANGDLQFSRKIYSAKNPESMAETLIATDVFSQLYLQILADRLSADYGGETKQYFDGTLHISYIAEGKRVEATFKIDSERISGLNEMLIRGNAGFKLKQNFTSDDWIGDFVPTEEQMANMILFSAVHGAKSVEISTYFDFETGLIENKGMQFNSVIYDIIEGEVISPTAILLPEGAVQIGDLATSIAYLKELMSSGEIVNAGFVIKSFDGESYNTIAYKDLQSIVNISSNSFEDYVPGLEPKVVESIWGSTDATELGYFTTKDGRTVVFALDYKRAEVIGEKDVDDEIPFRLVLEYTGGNTQEDIAAVLATNAVALVFVGAGK